MAMTVEREKSENGVVIRVAGEVDLYSSPELRKAILESVPAAGGEIGVDLSAVTYIDSSGVATLVEGLRSARESGACFVLMSASTAVLQVLELARLDSVFEVR